MSELQAWGALFLVAVSVAAGALIVLRHRRLSPAAEPFVTLLETARPLFLPLFAVLIVGAVHLPVYLLLPVVCALSFLAGWLIVRPEAKAARSALGKTALLAVLVGVAALLLLMLVLSSASYWESLSDVPAFLLLFALCVWLLAFVARLVSYASSWLRAAVAIAFALAGARLAMAVGLLPGDAWTSESLAALTPGLLVAMAVGLLLLEAVLDVVATLARHGALLSLVLRVRDAALSTRVVSAARGIGAGAAMVATAALLVSTSIGLLNTAQPGAQLTARHGVPAAAEGLPAAPRRVATDRALAEAYSPVLAFTHQERWSPVAVDPYVEEATLRGPLSGTLPPGIPWQRKLDRSCPRLANSPCYTLTIDCPDGHESCGEGEARPDRSDDRLYREGAVYARVLHRPPTAGPYAASLSTLLQYWYFYRYDEWEAQVFAGQLVQRHEGDWEAVTVGLSEREPLFVAYSAHCAGSWEPWEAVELSDKFPEPTHPLVAVAQGSHANYARADQKRSPDWAHCQGVPAGTTTLLGYASNIRDKTEYGWQWYPAEDGLKLVGANRAPMSFPGYWGAEDTTSLVSFFKTDSLGKPGPGPRTPSQQGLWQRPLQTIFCGRYTGPKEGEGCGTS